VTGERASSRQWFIELFRSVSTGHDPRLQ
jgi:hypothetical protein